MIYDTLERSKALRVSVTSEQTEALPIAFPDGTEENVATERDIAGVKGEIAKLRAELKTEIAELRSELRTGFATVRKDIADLRAVMIRWIVGAIAFNLLGTICLIFTVAQLVAKTR